jgi:predicted metal-dependent HD superfamily phosphohydrolase
MRWWGSMNNSLGIKLIIAITEVFDSLSVDKAYDTNPMIRDALNAYSESHRYYHNLTHIKDCFEEFEEVKDLFKHSLLSKYVLINHDLVYIPGFKDNETASAARAKLMSQSLGLSEEEAHLVTVGILATNHSNTKLDSLLDNNFSDEKLIKDIDLSILGADRNKFMAYEIGIRKEFGFCSDADYIEGRDVFLSTLLASSRIYLTGYFYDKYEKKARENINHLLDVLTAGK